MRIDKNVALGDQDERFLVAEIDLSNNNSLTPKLADHAIKHREGANALSRSVIKHGVDEVYNGPNGHSIIDTVSNKEFVLVEFIELPDGIKEGQSLDDTAAVSFVLGEMKNNEIVGTHSEAAKSMGLPESFHMPSVTLGDIKNPYRPGFWTKNNLAAAVNEHQRMQSPAKQNGSSAVDIRAVISSHTKRGAAIDMFLSIQKEHINRTKEALLEFDDNTNLVDASKEERVKSWAERTQLTDKIKSQELHAFYAIVTPEKFVIDEAGNAVLTSGDELNNAFAKTTGETTTPLLDASNVYNIGKVGRDDIKNSPSIREGETLLSAIRVRTAGDTRIDTNIFAVENQSGVWIRAERSELEGVTQISDAALAYIGIDSNKLAVGNDVPKEQIMAQITPNGLREIISRKQILDHSVWKREVAYDGEPIKQHTASEWAYPRSSDTENMHYMANEVRAMREVDARKADNRASVVELSQKQIDNLELFGIIREAAFTPTTGFDYLGGASGFVIKDNETGSVQVIGQALIHTDRNSGVGDKKVETTEFDFAIRPDRPDRHGVQYAVSGSSPGTISMDLFSASYDEQHSNDYELAGDIMRAYKDSTWVSDSNSSRYTGKNVVEAIAKSSDVVSAYDPKLYNDFGRGIKHESITKLENAMAANADYSSKIGVEQEKEASSRLKSKL